jgi:iron complex transport system ATP-binding protein
MAEQVSSDKSTLWSLSGVNFSYGDARVLHDIDLRLDTGKWYGILGPNGCGKTTLLDILSGIVKPEQGSITFMGKPIHKWSAKKKAQLLGLVPQDFMVRFGFTVREAVEMGLHPHRHRFAGLGQEDHQVIEQSLQDTGIIHLAERPVTRLSGGEKQRVALARTLAQRPKVILLDEATSNLDIRHSLEILHLIRKRFNQGSFNVVSVMHDLNLASFFCDELIFMKNGTVVSQGITKETLTEETIEYIYEVEAQILENNFTNSSQVSFRLTGGVDR